MHKMLLMHVSDSRDDLKQNSARYSFGESFDLHEYIKEFNSRAKFSNDIDVSGAL